MKPTAGLTACLLAAFGLSVHAQSPASLAAALQSLASLPPDSPQEAARNTFTLIEKTDWKSISTEDTSAILPILDKALTNPNSWVRKLASVTYTYGVVSRYMGFDHAQDLGLLFDRGRILSFLPVLDDSDEIVAGTMAQMLNTLASIGSAFKTPVLPPEAPELLKRFVAGNSKFPAVQASVLSILVDQYTSDPDTIRLLNGFWDSHQDDGSRISILKCVGLSQFQGNNPKFVFLFVKGLQSDSKAVRREAIQYGRRLTAEPAYRSGLFRISNDTDDTEENRRWALLLLQGKELFE